jgi:hypothetical protein
VRHGLCAETIIEIVEDVDDYKGFEAAVIADYDAETAVEREFVLRLASLLWRIRRATSIETDLMRIQAEILQGRHDNDSSGQPATLHFRVIDAETPTNTENDNNQDNDDASESGDDCNCRSSPYPANFRDLTYSFQRLTNLDNGAFDRLGRYESALWRQIVQLLFVLQPRRRR